MKKIFLAAIVLCISCAPATSQYYYKDLVTVQQVNATYRTLKGNKVSQVTLSSFQGEVPIKEGFVCEQKVYPARNQVITYTKTADAGESFFTAYYTPAGLLSRSVDSTEESVSTSLYAYDPESRLIQLSHQTRAVDNSSATNETHIWQYLPNGKPSRMLRIKNGTDTTVVTITLDEKGNVGEEAALHKGLASEKVYYYYDEKNRLTDVVRYNAKARRLLPDYIFEYEDDGALSSMTLVPEGSNDYQKWYYKYEENGLKAVDFCYNKKTELLGKIEYNYTLSK